MYKLLVDLFIVIAMGVGIWLFVLFARWFESRPIDDPTNVAVGFACLPLLIIAFIAERFWKQWRP